MRGKFITFEGVEGGGKSSNIAPVRDYLQQKKLEVIVTREPGGTPMAEEIREILLKQRQEKVDNTAELLLVFAARAQHFNTHIVPALERGAWVLCDRFTDATYAYQGAGRGLDMQTISKLESLVQGDLRPDLTLLFDLDVSVGLTRARGRGELDRFEQQEQEFFERIRALYLERASNCTYYKVVNAELTFEQVKNQVQQLVDHFYASTRV